MSETSTLTEATRDNFRDLVAQGTVLVDVWGPDCRPCLALLPHVEALAEKYADEMAVIKLEAPKARRLCMELSIMGMPAFLLFRDGVEVARLSDPALTPLRLNQWLDEQRKEVSWDVLKDRLVIALGERDGISGVAIAACATAAGAQVAFVATECFVWTASGAMDLQSQEAILRLAKANDPMSLLVLLGAPDPEAAEISAETVIQGDPAYAGALAGAQLGLDVYHVLDDAVKAEVPDAVWDEQIGIMADVLDADALVAAVRSMRPDGS